MRKGTFAGVPGQGYGYGYGCGYGWVVVSIGVRVRFTVRVRVTVGLLLGLGNRDMLSVKAFAKDSLTVTVGVMAYGQVRKGTFAGVPGQG